MRLSLSSLIVVGLSCSVAALATTEKGVKGNGASAADVASGASDAAASYAKAGDVEKKLEKEVGEMVVESVQKTKSLKGMLTSNGAAIAALTGLFKEVSRMTSAIGEFEDQLHKCKADLALTKNQQQAGPENDAFFNSASSDPLAAFFFQKKAEKALEHANRVFSNMQQNSQGVSLLQRRHRHRTSHTSAEDSDAGEKAESDADGTSDAITFGMNTIGAGEEDMDSRVENVAQAKAVMPGTDPLQYGMYDFTGSHGVKIFDHDSMDPDVQRRRELAKVNMMSHSRVGATADDSEDD